MIATNTDCTTTAGTPALGPEPEAATRNACKLCAPLGAAMVFKGIRGCLPFLHGSQGCATYIRRYMISHFREPVDIASSSFSEDDAIFGGARNFELGIENVISQYQPELIGVATTCLSETIGDHMLGMIKTYQDNHQAEGPPLVHVSTPAYSGTHSDGYFATTLAIVKKFALPSNFRLSHRVNIIPAMMSCADLRHLRELCERYGLSSTLLPDYNATLEGGSWDAYHRISPGGTSLEEIEEMGASTATLELSHSQANVKQSAGSYLKSACGVPLHSLGWPIGIRLSDQLFTSLSEISGREMPSEIADERARLVDAYVDAHKYVSGKTAALYGEPDFVIGMAAFLSEIGVRPILCATGSKTPQWKELLHNEIEGGMADVEALTGVDHAKLASRARERKPDLLIGSSKGYPLARELGIPLLRCGFPIHDRIGGQRQLYVGYRGTQQIFDRVVNAFLEAKQKYSETGYSYL
ncbi:nitrogenase component 1 [Coraliomargarita sp. SDUM461003]|uniref:Nitrogenase component 1 n=1 Tax=Thalassobacterium maritimum TaxID=3041265 RepID=A0ABU1AYI5_9BACT|nr:nitrogenase component 1 [Coraliomargarita sp. SDUM461003]MDQ8208314.1 nitrogenase component 1 [Coraliomargarita sp. SDUM461003]